MPLFVFGFRSFDLVVIAALAMLLIILTGFAVMMVVRSRTKRIDIPFVLTVTFAIPIAIGVLVIVVNFVHGFITSPMTVRKYHLEGNYVINRDWFKGPNADWQYEHYWMQISNDTLYLHIMNQEKQIKQYSRVFQYIFKGKHRVVQFYNEYDLHSAAWHQVRDSLMELDDSGYAQFQTASDTVNLEVVLSERLFNAKFDSAKNVGGHHMLQLNPLLHADPFSFNLVLRPTRYGNMFFQKGDWKPSEQ
ncbi:hypothetical protein [Williamwhitmania taraxaci]|uniref:Uncharacterized protein n=1 Tax=Williamwhitmania taraxaci TaxID=1640674 RepID=A0A1G6T7H1_9BACT|nr:hypothetical protein [Williamwhitmania taraxaci]SDD24814.1 hypothetical protein SAMN05216323_11144 [Williamwhitmania taraxaci]